MSLSGSQDCERLRIPMPGQQCGNKGIGFELQPYQDNAVSGRVLPSTNEVQDLQYQKNNQTNKNHLILINLH